MEAKERAPWKSRLFQTQREEAISFYLHGGAVKRPDGYFNILLEQ